MLSIQNTVTKEFMYIKPYAEGQQRDNTGTNGSQKF